MITFNSTEDCLRYISENEIAQFDIKFCDLTGRWHHITILRDSLDARLIEIGVGFDSSSIPRFRDVRQGDMAVRPDLSACFMDTTFDSPTLSSIGDIVEAGSGDPTTLDPRGILKRALDHMKENKIADNFVCAPEMEFYLFTQAEFMNDPYSASFSIGSPGIGRPRDAMSNPAYGRMMEGQGYLIAYPQDIWQNQRSEMADAISKCGIPVRYHHIEVGVAGQQEIELGFSDALTAADGVLLSKYLIRDIAVKEGIEACFLPKPIAGAAGNGQHVHFRLLKKNENLFAGDGYGGISELGRFFIGGILFHGRSIMSFACPTTNSYKRLQPGHETPVRFFYSVANREAAIRIPKYSVGKHARCEFRPGDPTMNPYLAVAALLMAGIDGIKNKIDPTEHHLGPFDGEPPEIDPNENQRCFLPEDLRSAIKSLQNDNEFLTAGGVFDPTFIKNYIEFKLENELHPIEGAPHPLEYEMYWGL
ncbi:MAG TPA: hypothetical protein ENN67_01095 [Firmicutes bacterium]|nr:hypothetical protein [Bacillota bacterium]